MSTVLAKGAAVFPKMLGLQPLPFKTVQPLTVFPDGAHRTVFVTYLGIYVVFYQSVDDTLRSETDTDFQRRVALGAFSKGVISAAWSVTAYKTLVYFALAMAPGGRWIKRGVNLASLSAFWSKHRSEILKCYEEVKAILGHMRAIYARHPTLAALMVSAAVQMSITKLKGDAQKKGLWSVVKSHIDFNKMSADIADFVGQALKAKLFPSGSGPARWLASKGLKQVAEIVAKIHAVYKTVRLVRVGKQAVTPKLADPHLVAVHFVTVFAKSGVAISVRDGLDIAKEIQQNPGILKRLDQLSAACVKLEKDLVTLTRAANAEVFMPI